MKLTKRERVLITALGLFIAAILFYTFLIKPQLKLIGELEEKKLAYEKRYKNTQSEISPEEDIKYHYKKLNTEIMYMTNKFLPYMYQEKIIIALDEMLRSSELDGYSITFSEPTVGKIDEEKKNEEDLNYLLKELTDKYLGDSSNKDKIEDESKEEKKEKELEINVEKMTANIFFRGKYSSVIEFISKVEEYEKKIVIKNLNIVKDENTSLTGSIVLETYSIPKIHMEDGDFINWNYNNIYGKDNPFNILDNGLNKYTKDDNEKEYDFIMNVRPETSDLPTIIFGRTNDINRSTYVYADSNTIENVDIYFIEENGKYYCKYKTSRESYPKNFNNTVEFLPKDDTINIQVFTYERNSSSDLAGARLSIHNNTDKKVLVDVIGDDKNKPRITVSEESNVVINRE